MTRSKKDSKIFYRIYPANRIQWEYLKISDDCKSISLKCPKQSGISPTNWKFESDKVFYNSTQTEIFETVTENVLENLITLGNNAIILAFGQTGAGKSLTISGLQNSFEDRGIIPRIISDLFRLKATLSRSKRMCIKIAYLETTKFHGVDLLKPLPNSFDATTMKHVTKIKISNENEALEHLFLGEGRKKFLKMSSYFSNLATSIFTFHIAIKNMQLCGSTNIKISRLHIIDLGGTDTAGNLSCFFKSGQEIGFGNLAKSQLEQFLIVIHRGIPQNVKLQQRLNLIIQYLGNSLSNESILRYIGHLRVAVEDVKVTLAMLRFGQIAVTGLNDGTKRTTKTTEEEKNEKRAKNEINKMKFYYAIFSNMRQEPKNLSQDRLNQIQQVVQEYVENKINDCDLFNTTDIKIVLETLKGMYSKCQIERNTIYKKGYDEGYAEALTSEMLKQKMLAESRVSDKPSKTKSRLSNKSNKNTSQISLSKSKRGSKEKSVTSARPTKSSKSMIKSKSSKSTIEEPLELPELIPEFEDAWNGFIQDEIKVYKKISDEYKRNADNAKGIYKIYLNEVEVLKKYLDVAEIRKNELIRAKINEISLPPDDLSDDEGGNNVDICLSNLNKIENQLEQQQETVLKIQAELKVHLDACQKVKKILREKFNDYCKEGYKITPFPSSENQNLIAAIETIVDVEEIAEEEVKSEGTVKTLKDNKKEKYEKLKQLMWKEMAKNDKKKKKWVQY